MKSNIRSMTRKELEKLKFDVDKALQRIGQREKKMALAAAEKAAAAHGYSLAEIASEALDPSVTFKNVMGPATKSAPKYRNPENEDQTWTGRGRKPEWFKSAIAAGTEIDSMAI